MASIFSVKEEASWSTACGKGQEEVETVGLGIVPVKNGRELTRVRGLPSTFRAGDRVPEFGMAPVFGEVYQQPRSSPAVEMEKMKNLWL